MTRAEFARRCMLIAIRAMDHADRWLCPSLDPTGPLPERIGPQLVREITGLLSGLDAQPTDATPPSPKPGGPAHE